MRKPFLTDCKTQPPFPGFEILNFSIILFILHYKYPNNLFELKNFVHGDALQSQRAISDSFSFFMHTVYAKNPVISYC